MNALRTEIIHSLSAIAREEWDALVGPDDPFAEYAFLETLEASTSVDELSGWTPSHLLVREGEALIAAAPLYIKEHSYGEFIFDFAWANAAERARIPYYPKLVSMTPFTPATGSCLLISPSVDRAMASGALRDALINTLEASGASSLHMNFLSESDRDLLKDDLRFLPRESTQYHFENPGYGSFDDFLGELRSSVRKQIRRERREANALGLEIELLEGDAIGRDDLIAMGELYRLTSRINGSYPYIDPSFFELAYERLRHLIVMLVARREGKIVAASISFRKGKHLYGRYWGAHEDFPFLHFEFCYYRLIEYAIERGITHVEAGAQGPHKIKRGFIPDTIHSVHAFAHPGLHAGVAEHLAEERQMNRRQMEMAMRYSPFREGVISARGER